MRKKIKWKKKSFKKLHDAAKHSLKHGYYLQTIWIVSQLVEALLTAFISSVSSQNQNPSLETTLKQLKFTLQSEQDQALSLHFSTTLLHEIRQWRSVRNRLFKDMATIHISDRRFISIAEGGLVLLHELNDALHQYKAAKKIETASIPSSLKSHEQEKSV